MILNDIKSALKGFASSERKTRVIYLLGIIGIVLIALSGIKPRGDAKAAEQKTASEQGETMQAEVFKEQVTAELENILAKIDGVGDCSVMLSVNGTAEYVYAENTDKTQDYSSNGSNEKYGSEVVIIDNGSSKQALVKRIIKPKVSGVVVVCRGGGDITVKERVIKAVSAALDLPYGKICVEGKTNSER